MVRHLLSWKPASPHTDSMTHTHKYIYIYIYTHKHTHTYIVYTSTSTHKHIIYTHARLLHTPITLTATRFRQCLLSTGACCWDAIFVGNGLKQL